MKPILIVEGKKFKVISINFDNGFPNHVYVTDDNGKSQSFVDIKEDVTYYAEKPNQINLSECLVWQGRYDDVDSKLQSNIEELEKEIQCLANEIADEIEITPFTVNEKGKKREALKQRLYGLLDAQDLLSEFIQDDVDLSGEYKTKEYWKDGPVGEEIL